MSKVIIAKANEESDLRSLIDSSLRRFRNPEQLSRLQRVVIKPNLCALMSPESGATTDSKVIEALVNVIREYAPKADIVVVESDTFERDAEQTFAHLGYSDLAARHNVQLVNLTRSEKITVSLPRGSYLKKVDLPLIFLNCDFFVSVSKLKTHLFERCTGVLKNQFGCVPEKIKTHYHPFLKQVIPDINSIIKPDFCILDGIVAMQGKGPTWGGRPKRMNVLLFSDDPVAVDAVGSRIMGINPKSVPHLVACHNRGIGNKDDIEIVGEDLNQVSSTFEVPDRYTYYSCRTGLMMQRIAQRFDQCGKWMIETQWKHSRPVTFVARNVRRISKKGLK